MEYLLLKWIHIVSSTFLFGTGVGSAFYKLTADLGGDQRHIAHTNRTVVLADWLFTTPTAIIQPVSGVMLAHMLGFPLTSPWLLASILLYVVIMGSWIPVVFIQMRMHRMSRDALAEGVALGPGYRRLLWQWILLGVVAFFAMIGVFYLMVFKPPLRL